MGRIFISAGHGAGDPGIKVGDTTEAQEMILLRNQIVTQLGDRGFQNSEVLSVPDNLSISQTIQYQGVIYARAVDLRNYDISVNWDSTSRTVILQPSLNPKIIGQGKASAE